jgi:FHA domain
MSTAKLTHWKPREMVTTAVQRSLEEFSAECDAQYLLLIKLDDLNSELAIGLATQEPRDRDGLGFRTVQRNVSSVIESLEATRKAKELAQGQQLPPKLALRTTGSGAAGQLPHQLRAATCYVLPLRKRSEAAFLRSVSVGRARNHDIVLRHRSVSKFHGSFDFDEQGRLFVRDANSSNHTFVNGEQVKERAEVHPGDAVNFGSVETHLCTTEEFWRTLHS